MPSAGGGAKPGSPPMLLGGPAAEEVSEAPLPKRCSAAAPGWNGPAAEAAPAALLVAEPGCCCSATLPGGCGTKAVGRGGRPLAAPNADMPGRGMRDWAGPGGSPIMGGGGSPSGAGGGCCALEAASLSAGAGAEPALSCWPDSAAGGQVGRGMRDAGGGSVCPAAVPLSWSGGCMLASSAGAWGDMAWAAFKGEPSLPGGGGTLRGWRPAGRCEAVRQLDECKESDQQGAHRLHAFLGTQWNVINRSTIACKCWRSHTSWRRRTWRVPGRGRWRQRARRRRQSTRRGRKRARWGVAFCLHSAGQHLWGCSGAVGRQCLTLCCSLSDRFRCHLHSFGNVKRELSARKT